MPEITEGDKYKCPDCGFESESELGIKVHRGRKHFESDEERFWDKVNKGEEHECWEWVGCKNNQGYGEFYCGQDRYKATHYILFEILNEDFDGEVVMHYCDNPSCVNPNHLKVGTYKENTKDCINKGRRTQTKIGEENLHSELSKQQVIEIKRLLKEGEKHRDIASKFDVSKSCISMISNGSNWSHITV